jgi:hypothetical protein
MVIHGSDKDWHAAYGEGNRQWGVATHDVVDSDPHLLDVRDVAEA